MLDIKQLCPKLSDAILGMCSGLRRQHKRKNFTVNMGTYGNVKDGMCYGCAAACAIQELTGKNYGVKTLAIEGVSSRARRLNIYSGSLLMFEHLIDDIRRGILPAEVMTFFGVPDDQIDRLYDLHFESKLPEMRWYDDDVINIYETFAIKLYENGF